jgi:hypothetical protein
MRITSNSQSLIDLILTKVDDTKTSDSGVIHVVISDHSLIYICRKIGIIKENPKLVETRQLINNTVSGKTEIRCGVPQVSNLDPLLFLIYISTTFRIVYRQLQLLCLQMTQIYLSCTGQTSADIEYKISKDLENIRKWIISNQLTLNIGKTEYMIIGSKPRLEAIPETPK